MKKFLTFIFIFVINMGLFAQSISTKSGEWSLLGAINPISNMSVFTSECVNVVWVYENSEWYSYSPKSGGTISSIKEGKGFWIKGESDCSLLNLSAIVEGEVNNELKSVAYGVLAATEGNIKSKDSLNAISNSSLSYTPNIFNSRSLVTMEALTYDATKGALSGVANYENNVIPYMVEFYKKSGDIKVDVDIKEMSSWVSNDIYTTGVNSAPLADLIGSNFQPDLSQLYMIMSVNLPENMSMPAGEVSLGTLTSTKTDLPLNDTDMPEKITFTGEGYITMKDGTGWNQKDFTVNIYPADETKMDGTYTIYETIEGSTFEGVASFNGGGCLGANITKDGEPIGTIKAEDGQLYLIDEKGNKTPISINDL